MNARAASASEADHRVKWTSSGSFSIVAPQDKKTTLDEKITNDWHLSGWLV